MGRKRLINRVVSYQRYGIRIPPDLAWSSSPNPSSPRGTFEFLDQNNEFFLRKRRQKD
jgi:hypothetical protein